LTEPCVPTKRTTLFCRSPKCRTTKTYYALLSKSKMSNHKNVLRSFVKVQNVEPQKRTTLFCRSPKCRTTKTYYALLSKSKMSNRRMSKFQLSTSYCT
jgi:hypothetical protein